MIKFIVFDLGGVVFSSDGASYEGREKLAEKFGIDKNKLHEFWFKKKNLLITGKMPEEEFLKEIVRLSKKKTSIEELKRILRDENKIDKDMINLLNKLKENYSLAVLNNEIKELNEDRIDKFNLREYFKLIISSCDVGFAKPDSEIYRILLNKINARPEEIVFIDNRIENLAPAEKLGIKTHLFENKDKLTWWFKKLGVDYQ
jgi:putative hydrolase of the HAD superfamily